MSGGKSRAELKSYKVLRTEYNINEGEQTDKNGQIKRGTFVSY